MGRTVVQVLAVGTPEGEHLKLVGVVLHRTHLAVLQVVEYQVALRVEHLDLVQVARVKRLHGQVSGVGNERQTRVPRRVDAGRERRVGLQVGLDNLSVIVDDRAAQVLAGMELHALRVAVLVVVAVDALAVLLRGAEHVVVDDALVVALQATLVDGQLLVCDVAGRDEAIGEPRVDAVGRHVDMERLIAQPLAVALGKHLHADSLVLCSLGQPAPVGRSGHHLAPFTHRLLAACSQARHHFVGLVHELEVEGRHVDGNGHIGIVGVDIGRRVCLGIVGRHLGILAGGQQEQSAQECINDSFHVLCVYFRMFGKFAAKVSKKAESAKLSPPFYVAFARKAKLCTTCNAAFVAFSEYNLL